MGFSSSTTNIFLAILVSSLDALSSIILILRMQFKIWSRFQARYKPAINDI